MRSRRRTALAGELKTEPMRTRAARQSDNDPSLRGGAPPDRVQPDGRQSRHHRAIAVVVLYSGYTVIIRGNSPGSLFSFITSVIMLYEPLKRVARLHVDLSSALFGVGMLYDFLDEKDF